MNKLYKDIINIIGNYSNNNFIFYKNRKYKIIRIIYYYCKKCKKNKKSFNIFQKYDGLFQYCNKCFRNVKKISYDDTKLFDEEMESIITSREANYIDIDNISNIYNLKNIDKKSINLLKKYDNKKKRPNSIGRILFYDNNIFYKSEFYINKKLVIKNYVDNNKKYKRKVEIYKFIDKNIKLERIKYLLNSLKFQVDLHYGWIFYNNINLNLDFLYIPL